MRDAAAARLALLRDLDRYLPFDAEEAAMAERLKRFVEDNPACFSRTLPHGHITGSAWIVDPDRTHVLLTHHRALGRWLQPGGHCEEDEASVLETALREAREETGLRDIRPIAAGIFDLDVHPIPARKSEPAHFHYDVRYLLEAGRAQPLVVTAESRDLAWVRAAEVTRLNPENSIARLARKAQSLFSS